MEASATSATGVRSRFERASASRLPDQVLQVGLTTLAVLILGLIAYFFVRLIGESTDALNKFGASFIFGNDWDISRSIYHGAPLVIGTLITSAIALIIGVPVAVATALYLTELCPRQVPRPARDAGGPAGGGAVGGLRAVGRVRAGAQARAG